MYSGNMGLGHRFGEILAAARDFAEFPEQDRNGEPRIVWGGFPNAPVGGRVRFVFYGGGKRRLEVEEFLGSNPGCHVELHDYAPMEILAEHLRSADVHLASLDAEWTGTMVPSKLQGIFEAGRPVIFIGNTESSIGSWVRDSGGGWVVRPGDVAGLHEAIKEARNPRLLMARGVAAKVYAESHFNKADNVSRVMAALGC
jgi:glycosyltransferase involved in cell wall biosynthesis